ncbi:hypothetical protein CEXT_801361 [Caerostris extrusa]|uniref:Uncharacterized protein n=1 Tax=Caerostris extrusa TaxID=172846 RepID=A0AAV4PQQ9_CAEEX|nr:hypothetical protein CEXT_801361 [Caerostris extrusa]
MFLSQVTGNDEEIALDEEATALVLADTFAVLYFMFIASTVFGNVHSNSCSSGRSSSYIDEAIDIMTKAKKYLPVCNLSCKPVDCEEVPSSGQNKSGAYAIWPRSRVAENKTVGCLLRYGT